MCRNDKHLNRSGQAPLQGPHEAVRLVTLLHVYHFLAEAVLSTIPVSHNTDDKMGLKITPQ